MPTDKQPTPEQTRDRLLGRITTILEEARKRPFMAPEIILAETRSALYAFMCEEFNNHAKFNGDVISRVFETLGLPNGATVEAMLAEIRRLKSR